MQTEIEAKFLSVNHDEVRRRLGELGAICKDPMRTMRRINLDFADGRLDKINGWVRLRDEGSKITLSYKQLNDRTLHGTKEVVVEVGDFDATLKFLEAIGLEQKSYQETKRESWKLDDVQIELDEWPWVKPYLEIEAENEPAVRKTAELLGLDWNKAVHGSVEIVYTNEYNVTDQEVCDWPKITFEPTPTWLEEKRK